MNLNELAVEISKLEGKKVNLSIGQIKEVIKIVCRLMYKNPVLVARMILNGKKQTK